ncbi:MAG: thioredoxin [Chloroflexi bacterium]|uniref:Thioredoxin n=1 Tax=Candidatus Thermofonsia Clade 3 bacterium TaxID=2364212 RepID=A0A2M8QFQ4_9CHLR|nr:thioredoxin [Candidatus Roseilinea sp. NK_OTU-006]PJF48572.1 MAG: thioredoxin [Candidatus Thermofonsia Clade 3 bacterium]RMG65589.1 MAG: thioredoxin [Chloroflexota bacterium]
MAKPVVLTDTNFEEMVEKRKGVVLVDFWAEWCGPCKMIAPIVEQIAEENAGKLTVGKLDVDANGETAMRFGVMSIPTLILFKNGEPVERLVGYRPKEQLMAKIRPHLS